MIGYIPSPPFNGVHVGPFELHFYGLLIAAGVLVAAWFASRRWEKLGGFAGSMVPIAVWAVIFGLVGARLYSVATSWQQDTGGDPLRIFAIWDGGLGIWGGVSGGVLGGWLQARRMAIPLPPLLDVVAPALPLAQAIGRWGNYFNQELFGLPSKLPWAVRITDQNQLGNIYPVRYRTPIVNGQYLPGTFQPTFLYECIWDLATFGLLLLIERRVKLRRGYLFAAYASLYTFGRFFVEYIRIDPAHRYLGLRLNDWTSVLIFVAATTVLLWKGRPRAGVALPAGLVAEPAGLAAEPGGLVAEPAALMVEPMGSAGPGGPGGLAAEPAGSVESPAPARPAGPEANPVRREELVGDPLPPEVLAAERAREAARAPGQPANSANGQLAGEESAGEESAGEESAGEESAGEESAGEESAGEESAGEESAGEESAGTAEPAPTGARPGGSAPAPPNG